MFELKSRKLVKAIQKKCYKERKKLKALYLFIVYMVTTWCEKQ